jgi:hypothetical protein
MRSLLCGSVKFLAEDFRPDKLAAKLAHEFPVFFPESVCFALVKAGSLAADAFGFRAELKQFLAQIRVAVPGGKFPGRETGARFPAIGIKFFRQEFNVFKGQSLVFGIGGYNEIAVKPNHRVIGRAFS